MAPDRRAGIAALYSRVQPRLERHVLARGSQDPTVVEDACSYAWMQLLTHDNVRLDPPPFNWLAVVARRRAWELTDRDIPMPTDPDELRVLADCTDRVAPSAEQTVTDRARLALVDGIPERQRRFLMRLAVGFSYEEIGALESASYTTVNKQLSSAKRRLRELDAT